MSSIHEIELVEILNKFPEAVKFNEALLPAMGSESIFIAILGFEDRCLSIPEELAKHGNHNAQKAFYFTYTTNSADNTQNKDKLLNALSEISHEYQSVVCDTQDFPQNFRDIIKACQNAESRLKVIMDISTCSSMPLLLAIKILFEFDVDLHILYSEAKIYHPTYEEWQAEKNKHVKEEGFGIAKGVSRVFPSPEHPGDRKDNLPEKVFVFPTFKPERIIAILHDIDPSIALVPDKHAIWFVGKPHLKENEWRIDAIKEINKITEDMQQVLVSTFDYKDTIRGLNAQWDKWKSDYHITIAPLGSKLQAIGIALFWQMHQELSMVFAVPEQYNAKQYSEKCIERWYIPLGSTREIKHLHDCVGNIELREI